MANDSKILAFCHLNKTGGTTIESILRRTYGFRHVDIFCPRGGPYEQRHMRFDLTLMPSVKSLSGHALRPCVDFGDLERRLIWFTWLRKPVDRYLSQYQHHVERKQNQQDFETWMRRQMFHNWQVNRLAGSPDIEAAKQIISEKMACIGLLERFDESLILLRHFTGCNELEVYYGKPKNTAIKGHVKKKVHEQFDRYIDDIRENNALDLELYRYATEAVFARQVSEFGEHRLAQEHETVFQTEAVYRKRSLRQVSHTIAQKMVYLPFVKCLHVAGYSRASKASRDADSGKLTQS